MHKTLIKGLRFGMLLQLSIGPTCIFILNTAIQSGFFTGLAGTAGVTLCDTLYVFAAIAGVSNWIRGEKTRAVLKIAGSIVLFTFGLNMALAFFCASFIPVFDMNFRTGNSFFTAFLITASNPLTVIFWSGVFSAKAAADNIKRRELYIFGAGAVLATLFFLSFASLLGSLVPSVVPQGAVKYLNLAVGAVLMAYSFILLFKRDKKSKEKPSPFCNHKDVV